MSDNTRSRSHGGRNGKATDGITRTPHRETQYIHLVRLAWDLHRRGLGAAVELASGLEPVLLVHRPNDALRVMALAREGTWFFTWGRGRDHRVRALANDAAERIWEVAR
ncbi:hypothetical protein Sme01_62290 [Sphaerisporangium melleum]|uniref:Uncharacterized protein n=1 Tax=Sphaerisporangium melleum TaxID=321316 RepID=A0A917VMC6_9ACTN|nr:hypothetical protein [Sphaerisporangium melleum]GGK98558.1 hypothetical protein GCM10007964_45910 [Sphaerisporangium melleum]GII73753.1 hypothetical protein Sme01_62290 [Sphaerisporangium melleum]